MASSQGYSSYGSSPQSSSWQPPPAANSASQSWTSQPTSAATPQSEPPASNIPAFYTAAQAEAPSAWQTQSGWQKGGSLTFNSNPAHSRAPPQQQPPPSAYYVPAHGYGGGAEGGYGGSSGGSYGGSNGDSYGGGSGGGYGRASGNSYGGSGGSYGGGSGGSYGGGSGGSYGGGSGGSYGGGSGGGYGGGTGSSYGGAGGSYGASSVGDTQSDYTRDTYSSDPYQADTRNHVRYPQSTSRPTLAPQAEVFKMANQRIMSQMAGPRGRGRGGAGGRGGGLGGSDRGGRGGARGGRGAGRGTGRGGTPGGGRGASNQKTPWPPKIGMGFKDRQVPSSTMSKDGGVRTQNRNENEENAPLVDPVTLLSRKNLIGLVWDYSKTSGDQPVHSSVVVYQNTRFVGTGRTKKDSKNDAAKNILKALGDPVSSYVEEQPATSSAIPQLYQLLQKKKWDAKLEFTFTNSGSPFECSITLGGQTFTGFGATKKAAKASVSQRALDAINTDQLVPPTITNPPEGAEGEAKAKDGAVTPLGQLHTRLGSSTALTWQMESVKSNVGNAYIHTATVTYEGRRFIAQDATKKGAKNNAAQEIFKAAAAGLIKLPEIPKKAVKRPMEVDSAEKAEQEPAVKQKKGAVDSTNFFGRVNALFPTRTQWSYVRSGPDHQPQYQACATLEGQSYYGVGTNKKEARSKACECIIQAVEAGTLTPPAPRPKPTPMDVDGKKVKKAKAEPGNETPMDQDPVAAVPDSENAISMLTRAIGSVQFEFDRQGTPHEPSFVCNATINERVFTGSAGSKKEAKLRCCQAVLLAIEAGEIDVSKKVTPQQTPQSKVAQHWPEAIWEYANGGLPHAQTYTATVDLDGKVFTAEAPAKKTAKMYCCTKIVEAIANGTLQAPQRPWSLKFSTGDIKRFNSMFGTPQIDMENLGTAEKPEFKASTAIDGQTWTGTGSNIQEATSAVIKRINEALAAGEMEVPLMLKFYRTFKRPRVLVEMTGTEERKLYTASFRHFGNLFTTSPAETAHEAERALALKALEEYPKMREAALANTPENQKTPMAILNERTANEIVMDVQRVEEDLAFKFIARATVKGQEYQGSGKSKPQAKQNCAAVILSEVFGHHFDIGSFKPPQTADDMQRGDIGSIGHQDLSTKVQTMVFSKYSEAVSALDAKYHGRKVLAGCVVTFGDDLESAEVISVAAGTKCIHGGNMSTKGQVVNDMHAEILVRRALKRYLYKQIELAQSGLQNVLIAVANGKYKLASGVRFHLFITSPPCGDSRIFVSSTSKEGEQLPDGGQAVDPNPDRHNRGQLRAKMETGQGTVPVKAPEINKVQSWDGIMAGDRYLNMSCCDKVARWALLGVQGSLLSTLIEPVYFSSVIVASMFHQAHIYRGIYGRVKDLKTLGPVAAPFSHHCMEIIGTVMPELRNTIKPPNHAVVWQSLTNSSEVLDTKNGLPCNSETSTLCKAALFSCFKNVTRGRQTPEIYADAKNTAVKYQDLKKRLHAALEAYGLGKWIGKPVEQDRFAFEAANTTPATAVVNTPTATPATAVKAEIPGTTPPASGASPQTRTSARARKGILKS